MNNLLKTLLIILFVTTSCSKSELEEQSELCNCVKTDTYYINGIRDYAEITESKDFCYKNSTKDITYNGNITIETYFDCN